MPEPRPSRAILPCHNEAGTIRALVTATASYLPDVLVIDDASSDATAMEARAAGARVLRLTRRHGKGAALRAGFQSSLAEGHGSVLTLDGDGQHLPDEIPLFLEAFRARAPGLVIGNRMGSPTGMPWVRRQANRLMSGLISQACGRPLPDTQCGFRLLRLTPEFLDRLQGAHFETESDQITAALHCGWNIEFVPITTRYASGNSHIQPVTDTLRWLRWFRHQTRAPLNIRRA